MAAPVRAGDKVHAYSEGSQMSTRDAAVRKRDRGTSWELPWKPSLSMAHLE